MLKLFVFRNIFFSKQNIRIVCAVRRRKFVTKRHKYIDHTPSVLRLSAEPAIKKNTLFFAKQYTGTLFIVLNNATFIYRRKKRKLIHK